MAREIGGLMGAALTVAVGVPKFATPLVFLAALFATPATASTAAEEAYTDTATLAAGDVTVDLPYVVVGSTASQISEAVAVYQRARQGFVLFDEPKPQSFSELPFDEAIDARKTHNRRYDHVLAYDLDTGEEVARAPLSPGGMDDTWGFQSIAVDQEHGLLYVASAPQPRQTIPLGTMVPYEVAELRHARNPCFHLTTYPNSGGEVPASCVTGFHVFDAGTLQPVGEIRLDALRADGIPLSPRILALEASGGKLRMLIQDRPTYWHFPALVEAGGLSLHEQMNSSVHYLVQADSVSGTIEWTLRVDSCRGAREGGTDYGKILPLPAPGMVFRPLSESDALYVGCHNTGGRIATVVRIPLDEDGDPAALPIAVGDPTAESSAAVRERSAPDDPGHLVRPTAGQQVFFGPEKALTWYGDRTSGRMLVRVVDKNQEVWWIFDTQVGRFIGTIGIGALPNRVYDNAGAGIDSSSGIFYVLTDSGLFAANVRSTPLSQALVYPQFAGSELSRNYALAVLDRSAGLPARIFYRDDLRLRSIDDRRPMPGQLSLDPPDSGRTFDLDEVKGVTNSVFDGAARAFAARVLLVGGADAVLRQGPVDPVGETYSTRDGLLRPETTQGGLADQLGIRRMVSSPCTEGNRDLMLAFVGVDGPAVVDSAGGRATAQAVLVDSAARADLEAPGSRCAPLDWQQVWTTALFGQPPTEEPRAEWPFALEPSSCLSGTEREAAADSDPVLGRFNAEVQCGDAEVTGWADARGVTADGVSIGHAFASLAVYRDPARGIVSRVEAAIRGLSIDGVFRVDTVRTVAESWANGRRQPVASEDRDEGYDANCDFGRTAGSCFRRHLFGVWTPAYRCGPCGDEQRVLDGMNRALGSNGLVMFRDPDPVRARGSENGFTAAIQKPDTERFADLVLNNDLLQTTVPGLEVIRFTAPSRRLTGGGPRGRQILQFAGVEVSSSYGIQCLLVYDEESNTCAAPAEAPGAIMVSLQDTDGNPLAGGAFEVRQDVDADGVLGLVDTLLPDGACVTAENGVGTCNFDNLQPGAYLVSQVAAPPGYAKSDEPFVVELASGEQRTVAFTNVSNVSTIELTAQDENGGALEGAAFAAYPDPDSDGKVAPDAQPAATCTTAADGACSMQVPAGSYVLVQTAAPGGLEGIEPVPFTFASGGQVAAVTVTNYPPETAGVNAPPPAPSPVYTPPVNIAPPVEVIDDYTPPAAQPNVAPGDSVIDTVGGTVVQVIRAPGDALRLLARDPKQGVAWTAALALFYLAVMAIRRRQQALGLLRS